jgi:hypothetical protein
MTDEPLPPQGPSVAAATSGARGGRLWRMRKLHQFVDAELYPHESGVELRYSVNGDLTYRRTWPTRDDASAEAVAKRAELERDGWVFHW